MVDAISRRSFLKSASLLSWAVAGGLTLKGETAGGAPTPIPRTGGPQLKVSLNAYSFAHLLNNFVKHRGHGISLFDLTGIAAKMNFDGFDPTGYYFPTYPAVPPDAYVNDLKRRAFELGLGISGTGVGDNLTPSDKAVRDQSVQRIKAWTEVAARLGAPVLRVFADTQMRAKTWRDVAPGRSREEVEDYIAEALAECAEVGKKCGVIIGVQNHGDFLQTAEQQLHLIGRVNSEWCGAIVDTGYYKTADPYADMAQAAPYAVNWQIKQSPFGVESPARTDLPRLMRLVRASGYRGYLPIEILSSRKHPSDPYQTVPAFLAEVRQAIAATA